jgi:hypothetical protein
MFCGWLHDQRVIRQYNDAQLYRCVAAKHCRCCFSLAHAHHCLLLFAVQPSSTDWMVLEVDDARGTLRFTRARIPDCLNTTLFSATIVAVNAEGSASVPIAAVMPAAQFVPKYPAPSVTYNMSQDLLASSSWWAVNDYPPQIFSNVNAMLGRPNVSFRTLRYFGCHVKRSVTHRGKCRDASAGSRDRGK